MFTVAFDARALDSAAGGVRRYTSELYKALVEAYPDVRWVAAGADAPAISGTTATPASRTLPTNAGWMLTGLPRTIRRIRPDVFHGPAYSAPVGAGCPCVLTLHDVVYARKPEWYPGTLDPVRAALFRMSARRATRVITDSEFSKREIISAYQLDPDRVDVVPLGVHAAFVPPALGASRDPVVLHVGDLHPRRNLIMVLDVVLALRKAVPALSRLTLTLVGVDRGSAPALLARAAAAGVPDALVWHPNVADAQLLDCYQRASVLAYPSRYEGFGLPLLEAMACGTPVVASREASMPEVVGAAGELLDPDDSAGWFQALRSVLTDPARARAMSEAGLARAATFPWSRTAAQTYQSFKAAVQPSR